MSTPAPKQRHDGRAAKGAAAAHAGPVASGPGPTTPEAAEIVQLKEEMSHLRRAVAAPVVHPFGAHSPQGEARDVGIVLRRLELHLVARLAAAATAADTTTNHVDVLLATLVVKISDIANITDVLSEKIEASGSSTSQSTCRILSAAQSAETQKLQSELAELRGMLATHQAALAALQPLVRDSQRSHAAQLEQLERLVADRSADVAKRIEASVAHLVAHADTAATTQSALLETRLERQVAALSTIIEGRAAAAADGATESVARLLIEGEARGDASLARRLSSLEAVLGAQAERTRTVVGERGEWVTRQVHDSQAPAFEAVNMRLDRLFEAVEGMQARFASSLGSLAAQQAKDTADLRAAVVDAEHANARQLASLASSLEHSRREQAATAAAVASAATTAEAGTAAARAAGEKVDALQSGLARLLADAHAPVLQAHAASTETVGALLRRLGEDAASNHEAAASRAGAHHAAVLEELNGGVAERVKGVIDEALNSHSQAAARMSAANAAEISAESATRVSGLEARLAKLEAALGAWFGHADEAHAAAAGSLASLHDGIWKGFDEAATHRRELAAAAKGELAALKSDVGSAAVAAATSAHAAETAVLDALSGADAPLRRAAEVTLKLLPGVADCETRIAASVGELHGAVSATEALARSASDAAASAASGVKELLSAHKEAAATVQDLASRQAGVSRDEVDAVVRAAHADLRTSLSSAHEAAAAAVENVHDSVRSLEKAHSAGVSDASTVASTIAGLRQDMWKGFDDAATHRRELAGAAKGDLAALQGDVSSAASAAAGSARAAETAIVEALAADAPLRRAAEVTLALLPGTAEAVTLVASTTSELRGAVEAARSGATAAAVAAEAGAQRAASAQAATAAVVEAEAGRVVRAVLEAIGASAAATGSDVKGAVGAAQAALKEAIDGVQASASALSTQCSTLATAQDAQQSLTSLASLHDGIWKGFDEAATQRRELAATAKGELAASSAEAAAAARSAAAQSNELLAHSQKLEAALDALQAALRSAHDHALRHASATSDLAVAVRDGFEAAARGDALERGAAERAADHGALLAALGAVSEALAEKTAASAAGEVTTRAELERLGAGLQELAYRVDALAQAYYGSNDTILGRLSALQLDLAAILRGEVAAAPPPPELSPVHKKSPPVWQPTQHAIDEACGVDESAAAPAPRTPAVSGAPRRASVAGSTTGSTTMMRLTLSTREEEALRRHMLRVGAAARYRAEPATPKPAAGEGGEYQGQQRRPSNAHHHHAAVPTPAAASVTRSGGGASGEDDRSHAGSFAAADDGMTRYHDALRATGHKLTERYIPSGGLSSRSQVQMSARSQSHLSARRSFVAATDSSHHSHGHGGADTSRSIESSHYNRHVHHSYGSLPVRSAATESYVQHFSPPSQDAAAGADITPGGGGGSSRSRGSFSSGADPLSARRLLDPESLRGAVAAALPPLADPHDHFDEADARLHD